MNTKIYTKVFLAAIGVLCVLVGVRKILSRVPVCSEEVRHTSISAITGAFDVEVLAILEKVERESECMYEGVLYHQVRYHDIPLLLFESGIGLQDAKGVVDATLSNFSITQLLFSGIAGSVDPDIPLGSVVVPEEWVNMITGERIPIAEVLLEKARTLQDVQIVKRGASFDTFITKEHSTPSDVHIVDMETAGIAQGSQEHQVPFIAFRAISDEVYGADTGTDETFEQAAELAAQATLSFLVLE